MNLLYERKQSNAVATLVPLQFGRGVMFTLWARVELDREEFELLQRYRFDDALLIADDWLATLRQSFRTALMLGFVVWWVLFLFLPWSLTTIVTMLAVIAFTCVYYNELREHIYVRDLLHGRQFRCFSVVELIHKEEYLKGITMYLRQVLESAKHWDGREVTPIPALRPEEARALVQKTRVLWLA